MPQLISKILGQEVALQKCLSSIEQGHFPHTVIFAGPSGVGKKMSALALAQVLVCQEEPPGSACGKCSHCVSVVSGQSASVTLIETESDQIKIDQAKDVVQALSLRHWSGPRVFIFDEAHKLNLQAGNALLKVLEEPPVETYFIMVTSNLMGLLPTLRSRSQVMRFAPLSDANVQRIAGVSGWVIKASQGQVDRAKELDSAEKNEIRDLAISVLENIFDSKVVLSQVIKSIEGPLKDKKETLFIMQVWQQVLRDMSVWEIKDPVNDDKMGFIKELASRLKGEQVDLAFQQVESMKQDIQSNCDRTLTFESGLQKIREGFVQ